ncbi:MAG: nicotinate-nucleotide adenylyltransferase [bacterium]
MRPFSQKQFGMIGGTFDPIHFGHLRAAEEIREIFRLCRLEFLPARVPPHKKTRDFTCVEQRIEMLREAIREAPWFGISQVEANREGPSYLVDTLRTCRTGLDPGSALFFIMGMDSFREIGTWHRFQELFHLADFIVTTRPGYIRPRLEQVLPPEVACRFREAQADGSLLIHESGRRIFFQEITLLDISATQIRKRIREGKSVRYLVPERVIEYIRKNGLYR